MGNSQLFMYTIPCFILICSIENSEELPGLTLKKLQACPQKSTKPATKLTNIRLKKVREKTSISYTLVLNRDVTNDVEVEAILTRCAASEALDTCERMRPFSIKHFCRVITMDNMPWSSFMKSGKPPITCPIKKGTYIVKDAEVSTGNFEKLPFISGFYKFEFIMREQVTNDVLLCVYVEAVLNP